MNALRRHGRWVLLPAMVWLAVQIAMAAGFSVPAIAADTAADTPASLWLCAADGPAPAGAGGAPHGPAKGCHWCHAFGSGAVAEPTPPQAEPTRLPALRNDPFPAPSARVLSLRTAAFQSRAPPAGPSV